MEEARRIIERLDRIDALRRTGAGRARLLAELRGLVDEGERWLAAEGAETERAAAALERCREALDRGEEVVGVEAA